ncbi:hypothetical protein M8J71_13390 [Pseudarthrobacter sp. R1]|uniref:hypothetical protein n=1 Tax=Pseudarthrobacter sp. R1 TaxID=2944934 RepID=UPI00210F0CF1|nr:hypothetical protein [Pseudarthrobacter sp. R1]MCQ6271473.1 hypothetical protein [Pseudarthrobacter sp. R1]
MRIETQGGQYGVGETYGDTEIIEYLQMFGEQRRGLTADLHKASGRSTHQKPIPLIGMR